MTLYITLAIGYKLSTKTNTLILLAYGIQIELVQSLLPHRYFSLLDIVADMVGVAIGVVIVWGIAKYIKGVI
jgi:VanZ family protein